MLQGFRLQVERGVLRVEGTETLLSRNRVTIPTDRAAEIIVDPPSGAVFLGLKTLTGVTVIRSASPIRGYVEGNPTRFPDRAAAEPVTGRSVLQKSCSNALDIDVALLDPDVVVQLLERHAEHVRSDLGVSLAPPGKASVIALLASKSPSGNYINDWRVSWSSAGSTRV